MTRRLAVLGVLALGFGASAEGAGVTARLAASPADVAPGARVDVELRIDEGEAWNGYELVLVYDPERLALVDLPDAEAEGALMTAACGERWRHVETEAGRVTLSHVLLCPGARVEGPGTLYRFRFTSTGSTGPADLGVERLRFLEAGRELSPVVAYGTTVQVGPTPVRALTWGRIKSLYR